MHDKLDKAGLEAHIARLDPRDREEARARLMGHAEAEFRAPDKRSKVFFDQYRHVANDFLYVKQDNRLGQSWRELNKPSHEYHGYRPPPETFAQQALEAVEKYANVHNVKRVYLFSPAVRADGAVLHEDSDRSYITEINFLLDENNKLKLGVVNGEGPQKAEDLYKFFKQFSPVDPRQKEPLKKGDTGFKLVIEYGERQQGDIFESNIAEGIVDLNNGAPIYKGHKQYVDPYKAMRYPDRKDHKLPAISSNPNQGSPVERGVSEKIFFHPSPDSSPFFARASTRDNVYHSPPQSFEKSSPSQNLYEGPITRQRPSPVAMATPPLPIGFFVDQNRYQAGSTVGHNPVFANQMPEYLRYFETFSRTMAQDSRVLEPYSSQAFSPQAAALEKDLTQKTSFPQENYYRMSPAIEAAQGGEKFNSAPVLVQTPRTTSTSPIEQKEEIANRTQEIKRFLASQTMRPVSSAERQMLRRSVKQHLKTLSGKALAKKVMMRPKVITSRDATTSPSFKVSPPAVKLTLTTRMIVQAKNVWQQATAYIRQKFVAVHRVFVVSIPTVVTRLRNQIVHFTTRLRKYLAPNLLASTNSRLILRLLTRNLTAKVKNRTLVLIASMRTINLLPQRAHLQLLRIIAGIRSTISQTRPTAKFTPHQVMLSTAVNQESSRLRLRPSNSKRRRIDEILFFLEQLRRNLSLFLYARRRKLRRYSLIRWITVKNAPRAAPVRDSR